MNIDRIEVRAPEDEAGTELPGGDVEFGLFYRGEWRQSVLMSAEEARVLLRDLQELLT